MSGPLKFVNLAPIVPKEEIQILILTTKCSKRNTKLIPGLNLLKRAPLKRLDYLIQILM